MKKIILITCTLVLMCACTVTKNISSITGQFYGITNTTRGKEPINLALFQDSTFHISWVCKNYTGIWKVEGKNKVRLKYDKTTDLSLLLGGGGGGAFRGADYIMYFANKNKIKIQYDFQDIKLKLIK